MIRLQQVKLPLIHKKEDLYEKVAKTLKIKKDNIQSMQIVKRSLDARKKKQIFYVYTLDVQLLEEKQVLKRQKGNTIFVPTDVRYQYPKRGEQKLGLPPVIIGSGPAGLFCAYALSQMGYAPIVIERGKQVDSRRQDVEQFWKTGILNTESNVQFGEGGAGTFSDGKLNTLVKDVKGRNKKVLETFCAYGAPEKILYESKPHIGTDILVDVILNMRKAIVEMGGKFYFETCMTDIRQEDGKITAIVLKQKEQEFSLKTELLVLAVGHSARDTFSVLKEQGLHMEAKSFATGFRVEHPQEFINKNQYGEDAMHMLPAADYKVTANLANKRGVYSFCMCPGGYVVNASSQKNRLAINGMSYSKRDGKNANSAIIVSVTPKDFGSNDVLAGVRFQEELETKTFQMAGGKIPQQLFGDFAQGKISREYGEFSSATRGNCAFAPLHTLFPKEISNSFIEGMHKFGTSIPGFDRYDSIVSGVESRTSSPVRICRNAVFESNVAGIYPCGEGAGYAGGIMSAAMDGLKVAEAIIQKYRM